MTCECKYSNNELSLVQQRNIAVATATLDKVFYEADRKFCDVPEQVRPQLVVTYVNGVIALLAAIK